MMKGMTRRGFLGAITAMGAMGAVGAMAGCSSEATAKSEATGSAQADVKSAGQGTEWVELSDGTIWTGTPEHIRKLGGSTMPLEEVNRRRKEYIESQTEWVNEDGSVVPLPYVQMRALIHSHGFGAGEGLHDTMFKQIMELFTEDEVKAYLDMPWGVEFTANEYYLKCQNEGIDRSFEECTALCEKFCENKYLPFRTRAEGIVYNIPAFAEGVNTYAYCDEYYADPFNYDWPIGGDGLAMDVSVAGTPAFMSVPLCEEVVADGDPLLAYDDIDKVIMDHEYIALQPCSCRYEAYVFECHEKGESFPTFKDFATGEYIDFRDNAGSRIETCLAMGDDAEYLVSLGLGRRISKEEALEIIQKGRDDGYILHCLYGKEHAWICQCDTRVCGINATWAATADEIGWDGVEALPSWGQVSHYELAVDFNKCVGCGTCYNRCPMGAIDMVDGAPQVTTYLCHRCGQCAYVCPQKARKLALRPEEERLEYPHLMQDDSNQKAAYRFENGLIGRGVDGAVGTKF